jgi:hypothetical protein
MSWHAASPLESSPEYAVPAQQAQVCLFQRSFVSRFKGLLKYLPRVFGFVYMQAYTAGGGPYLHTSAAAKQQRLDRMDLFSVVRACHGLFSRT